MVPPQAPSTAANHSDAQSEIINGDQLERRTAVNKQAVDDTKRVKAKMVGFFPNTDRADNKFQAKGILVCIVLGAIVFGVVRPFGIIWIDLLSGVIAGMVIGSFITGFIVMIKGLSGK